MRLLGVREILEMIFHMAVSHLFGCMDCPRPRSHFGTWENLESDMSEIYAHPLPRVYAIFLFAIEYSAKAQHTTTGAGAPSVAPPPPEHAPVVVCCVLSLG